MLGMLCVLSGFMPCVLRDVHGVHTVGPVHAAHASWPHAVQAAVLSGCMICMLHAVHAVHTVQALWLHAVRPV